MKKTTRKMRDKKNPERGKNRKKKISSEPFVSEDKVKGKKI